MTTATAALHKTRIDIEPSNRTALVQLLNQNLADSPGFENPGQASPLERERP